MTQRNNGGPAFPSDELNYQTGFVSVQHTGMALRDYFAAKALQVCLAHVNSFPDEHWRDGVALDAYLMADAMLKARNSQ